VRSKKSEEPNFFASFKQGSDIMDEQLKPQNVVIGQLVQEAKVTLSRQMRREMTNTEAILWLRPRRNGLGINFRRQQIIDGFIADFYCHEAALVIEVGGPIHDTNYDAERDRIFTARGINGPLA